MIISFLNKKNAVIATGVIIISFVLILLSRPREVVINVSATRPSVNNAVSPAVAIAPVPSASPSPAAGGFVAPLSGRICATKPGRPLAVMLSSDPDARPLYGLSEAEMVFEMPVINKVTRLMAVFQCNWPRKMGSIRSARSDFISFVLGLDALFVHFGGEHDALSRLNGGITDNMDCIKYDGSTCLRDGKRRPNNSYTTATLARSKAKELGYNTSRAAVAAAIAESDVRGAISPPVYYTEEFAVRWKYDPAKNRYFRFRAGTPEIDGTTRGQISARNVVALAMSERAVSPLYNRVTTTGSGAAVVYRDGRRLEGTWRKSSETAALTLSAKDSSSLALAPGNVWFEIITAGEL